MRLPRSVKNMITSSENVTQFNRFNVSFSSTFSLSGLPCLLEFDPPTETDGPLGAMAMALAFIRLGKRVTIMTDEANEAVVLAAGAALGATTSPPLVNVEEKRSPRASPGKLLPFYFSRDLTCLVVVYILFNDAFSHFHGYVNYRSTYNFVKFNSGVISTC